ncbi:MAG: transglycosylase domain-containing protein [Cytophagales bacterium]|nr:transglycosylase domain-containing protein [Cytophagales bacterium]
MNFGKVIIYIWAFFILCVTFIVLHVSAVNYNFLYLSGPLPDFEILENPQSELASELYSADGYLLGKYFRSNRTPIKYEQMSPNAIKALLATEDIRFEDHSGIDLKGIVAIPIYLIKGESRGSSTISQQLAKNLFNTRSHKYKGALSDIPILNKIIIKTKEWIVAIKIEKSYTKKEIITMYLNTVDFGSNAFGLKVASQTFFGTTPEMLTVNQAATLIALLKAPTYYSPVSNPERALARRNTVLEQMYKYNYLTKNELSMLQKQPLMLKYNVENHNQGIATYFRSVVNNYLLSWCKEKGYDLYSEGLKIYTTLDSRLQNHAEEAVNTHMKYIQEQFYLHWAGQNPWVDQNFKEIPNFIENAMRRTDTYRHLSAKYANTPDSIKYYLNLKKPMRIYSWDGEKDTTFSSYDSLKYYKKFLMAGLISLDPETGHIKAWVGGINHKYFKFDHVKQSKRQPGSTFKPIVYTAAIDNGFHPCHKVQDSPVSFYITDTQSTWTPANSDGPSTGEIVTLRQALARSINTVTAYIMKKIGPETVVDYAKKLGFKGNIEAVPALCLGISDVSIYELAGAYATFANKGIYTQPQFLSRIEDKNGNILQEFSPVREEALNEETAYTMLHMLKGGVEEKGGTSLGLHRYKKLWGGNEIGGKTGTTQNYSDGWYVGVTQNLVTAIWVGGDDRSIHFRDWEFGQGAKLAMPIFGIYMENVYSDTASGVSKSYFRKPAKLTMEYNCSKFQNENFEPDSDTTRQGEEYIYKRKSSAINEY